LKKINGWQENGGKKMLSGFYFHAPIFLPQSSSTTRVPFTAPLASEWNRLFLLTLSPQNRKPELAEISNAEK
jgi:hypothetical protein